MKAAYTITAGLLLSLTGCFAPFTRFQSAEDAEREKDLAVRTIGDVTEVDNVAPQQVSGIGLVTDLAGTGDCPQGNFRKMLETQLRQQKVENIKALLDSPDSAIVLVTGMLPAGLRKGERIDLEITLPPGSRATSLRGGYLHDCPLKPYESLAKLKPELNSNKLLGGHILAKGKGALMVGLGNPDEAAELRRARIWQGAVSLSDQPFYLHMKNDDKSSRVANAVAERLNLQFRDPLKKKYQELRDLDDVTQGLNRTEGAVLGKGEVAKALGPTRIIVRIPFAYRLHPERYLLVSRLVPLREDREQQARYRLRLHKMLMDPQETIRAALRLEALGQESVPALKKGLTSPHSLVRFAAAESLTYLGSSTGVEELARLAEPEQNQPLRFYCLLAMANLDESLCRTKLMEMLANPDVELRSGAFAALRLLDQADPTRKEESRLPGVFLNEAFWLHHVAQKSSPLIHISMSKRAEITLFGDNVNLVPPISIQAGPEFIISAAVNDDSCAVSRIRAHSGIRRHPQCALKVSEVIQAMADLGAQYPDIIEFLRKAEERRCLSCPLRINAFPEQIPLETLAKGGFE